MLHVADLQKTYGSVKAIKQLTFHVPSGEVYGLIGQDGAGKSTFMRICMGLEKADSGKIKLFGNDILNKPEVIQEAAGYLPQNFGIYENMQVNEYIDFYGALYGISYPMKKYSMELLELVNLSEKAECFVSSLSRSEKQCLGIARCLIHNPTLLILDEPFRDLDPVGKAAMVEILHNIKRMGKTILLTSSVLSELEGICTYVGIMKNGVMEIEGTIESVLTKIKDSSPILIHVLAGMSNAFPVLRENSNVIRVSSDENILYVGFTGSEEEEARLLQSLIMAGVSIVSFSRIKGNLENLVYELTEETERKNGHYEVKSSLFKRFKIKR